ncbi:MAG: hypothetical protein UT03_C0064G0007, partial [Candidatus Moranbacteria bacterium GW2011_GWD2_38_7]
MAIDAQGNPIYQAPTVVETSVPRPTAQTVYSAANIDQATSAPVAAPNLSDPYGIYDQFMNSADIKAARAKVAEGQGLINNSNHALRTTTRALENQNENAMGGTGASVNLIGRQVGRARQLTADELAGLGETQNANLSYLNSLQADAQNRYGIAQQERSQLQDLIRQTGGKAGISFTDSFESALQKADKYSTEKAKEDKKDAYKDALKTKLVELGLKTKGNTKELEKRLRKSVSSTKEYDKKIKDIELKIKQKELNKPYY